MARSRAAVLLALALVAGACSVKPTTDNAVPGPSTPVEAPARADEVVDEAESVVPSEGITPATPPEASPTDSASEPDPSVDDPALEEAPEAATEGTSQDELAEVPDEGQPDASDIEDLLAEIDELLAQVEGDLDGLDGDLAEVADGMNQDEGDI